MYIILLGSNRSLEILEYLISHSNLQCVIFGLRPQIETRTVEAATGIERNIALAASLVQLSEASVPDAYPLTQSFSNLIGVLFAIRANGTTVLNSLRFFQTNWTLSADKIVWDHPLH